MMIALAFAVPLPIVVLVRAPAQAAPPPAPPETSAPAPPKEAAPAPPTPPTETRDPTTGRREVHRDDTGQPVIERDETGQPIVRKDETGEILPDEDSDTGAPPPPRIDSLLRPIGPAGVLTPEEMEGRARPPIGTDWRAEVALVEGYNTNVVQSQQLVLGPVTKHPSPFTGVDATARMITWTSPLDEQELRLQVRGQHYTPINDGYPIPDDGTINGGWSGQFTLAPRTVLTGRVLGTVTSTNSAELDDSTPLRLDPSGLQRDYHQETARLAVIHELAPLWRLVVGADVEAESTIRDVPVELPTGGVINHHGLDYVTPAADVTVFHDLDQQNILSMRVRYEPMYVAFLVDYTRAPRYVGHATTQMGEGEIMLTHAFTERFRSMTSLGAVVSQAAPFDPDRRPLLSPVFTEELTYTKEYWSTVLGASYGYGSANPRLGFGPAASAALTMQGVPYPYGEWKHLAMLGAAIASRSAFQEEGGYLSRLTYVSAHAEARWGFNTWLGLMAGWDYRNVAFEGVGAFPQLVRHVVFLGLSGYWSTDHSLPTLDTFVSPVVPPG